MSDSKYKSLAVHGNSDYVETLRGEVNKSDNKELKTFVETVGKKSNVYNYTESSETQMKKVARAFDSDFDIASKGDKDGIYIENNKRVSAGNVYGVSFFQIKIQVRCKCKICQVLL